MRNINELVGIVKGIRFDGVINEKEVDCLQLWVDKNRNLVYESKQVELIRLVDSVLEDRKIEEYERLQILEKAEDYLNNSLDETSKIYELNGIVEGIVSDGIVNASAGGLYCGVKEDGYLKEKAYTLAPFSEHTKTDTGVILKDFRIPMYNELKKKAVELHQQLPYSKFIGWDLSVNKDNEIELVEINANCPGLFQGATGPAFGDYTEEILEYCKH